MVLYEGHHHYPTDGECRLCTGSFHGPVSCFVIRSPDPQAIFICEDCAEIIGNRLASDVTEIKAFWEIRDLGFTARGRRGKTLFVPDDTKSAH